MGIAYVCFLISSGFLVSENIETWETHQINLARQEAKHQIIVLQIRIVRALSKDIGQYPLFTGLKLQAAMRCLACAYSKIDNIEIEEHNTMEEDPTAYAWCLCTIPAKICVCPPFFDKVPLRYDPLKFRASIIVHELTHACGTVDARYFWPHREHPHDVWLTGYQDIASTYDTWILDGFVVPGVKK